MTRRDLRPGSKKISGRPVDWPLFYTDECGYRAICDGEVCNQIANDEQYQWAICAKNAAAIVARGEAQTIAHLGGGLCLLPRMLDSKHQQTVYELEPTLEEFCPEGVKFVPGDWRTTLTGLYDVIVYDIGDTPDRASLESHLNPGGLLLGLEG